MDPGTSHSYDSSLYLVLRIYVIHLSKEVKEHGGLCQKVLWTKYGSETLHLHLHSFGWNVVTWPATVDEDCRRTRSSGENSI